MATNTTTSYMEGHSTNRPPLFNGTSFAYWKNRMRIYIQSIDYDLWMTIQNGPHIPRKPVYVIETARPYSEWLAGDKQNVIPVPKIK